jgi:hypothetical protein
MMAIKHICSFSFRIGEMSCLSNMYLSVMLGQIHKFRRFRRIDRIFASQDFDFSLRLEGSDLDFLIVRLRYECSRKTPRKMLLFGTLSVPRSFEILEKLILTKRFLFFFLPLFLSFSYSFYLNLPLVCYDFSSFLPAQIFIDLPATFGRKRHCSRDVNLRCFR